MPRPIAEPDIADLFEPEATPLASAGQAGSTLATELIGECLLEALGMAKDDRAKLTGIFVVETQDLFLRTHGPTEQVIDAA